MSVSNHILTLTQMQGCKHIPSRSIQSDTRFLSPHQALMKRMCAAISSIEMLTYLLGKGHNSYVVVSGKRCSRYIRLSTYGLSLSPIRDSFHAPPETGYQ